MLKQIKEIAIIFIVVGLAIAGAAVIYFFAEPEPVEKYKGWIIVDKICTENFKLLFRVKSHHGSSKRIYVYRWDYEKYNLGDTITTCYQK